jgi:hypothetical protein
MDERRPWITPDLAAALTRALFCGSAWLESRMAVFVGNSDESGVADARGHFLVGGYIGWEKEWPYFASAWQERVLDGPPRIPHLHMRQIRDVRWRRKYGLSTREVERRLDQAVDVIGSAGFLSAVVSVIKRADLEDVLQSASRAHGMEPAMGIDRPDYLCFMGYARMALELTLNRHPNAKRLDFVVSLNGKITDHIKEFHEQLKLQVEPPFASLVGDLIPARMEDRLGLQAADFLCWHWQRYYAVGHGSKMVRSDERRTALLGETSGVPHIWTPEDLQELATAFFPS